MSKENIIDLSYLKEISNNDNAFMIELMDMFFEQVPEYQSLMHELHEKKDWEKLAKIAHKAKSSILMVGLQELAVILKKLEENAKEGVNINEYSKIIAKFVSDSNIALKELKEVRKKYN